jgi:hypothetical protein
MPRVITNKQYRVVGEIEVHDEKGKATGQFLEVGSVQEVPEKLGKVWVKKGLAEEVEAPKVDETADVEVKEEKKEPVEDKYKGMKIATRTIISSCPKVVNGKMYTEITLDSGETALFSTEELDARTSPEN